MFTILQRKIRAQYLSVSYTKTCWEVCCWNLVWAGLKEEKGWLISEEVTVILSGQTGLVLQHTHTHTQGMNCWLTGCPFGISKLEPSLDTLSGFAISLQCFPVDQSGLLAWLTKCLSGNLTDQPADWQAGLLFFLSIWLPVFLRPLLLWSVLFTYIHLTSICDLESMLPSLEA